MNKLLKRLGVMTAVMGLAVTPVGLVSANAAIGTTGPDSTNKIEMRNESRAEVENNNDLGVTNNNPQSAESGNARVRHNTEGGSATSGNAGNTSNFTVKASIDNSGSASAVARAAGNGFGDVDASISKTGPDSYNKIELKNESKVEVTNNNHVNVTNNNSQSATSGNAKVSGNTEGGNARSGNATNESNTSVTLTVKN